MEGTGCPRARAHTSCLFPLRAALRDEPAQSRGVRVQRCVATLLMKYKVKSTRPSAVNLNARTSI